MEIVAHRGLWERPEEKNSWDALVSAVNEGFGLETDLRDKESKIVISHDMPSGKVIYAEDFFEAYSDAGCKGTLALNIKADGLANELEQLLLSYEINEYFVFDMSVPDTMAYFRAGLSCFSRFSEFEYSRALNQKSSGIWLDELESEWVTSSTISACLEEVERVCLVSPELHSRPYQRRWSAIKQISTIERAKMLICTDFPLKARERFSED